MSEFDQKKYREAKKRVKAKKEFFEHLSTYLVMGGFFFFLNALTSFGHWWFFWPMLGWGIGVMFHYIGVFGVPGVGQLDKEWEKRALEKELDRMAGLSRTDRATNVPEEDVLDLDSLEKQPEKSVNKRWKDEDLV